MKHRALIAACLLTTALVSPALAQNYAQGSFFAPQPTSAPLGPDWQKIPGGMGYEGCLVIPLTMVPGCMGNGSINAGSFFQNGLPLTGFIGGIFIFANLFFDPSTNLPCDWSATGDAQPCILAAINIAKTNGGGSVFLPCARIGIKEEVLQTTSGIGLKGCGIGINHDNVNGSGFIAYTTLVWNGPANAPTVLYVGPPTPYVTNTESLYKTDLDGFAVDCQSNAAIGVDAEAINTSKIVLGAINCQSVNMQFIAPAIKDAPGVQRNEMWLYSLDNNTAYSPVGVLFDQAPGSNFNFSVNFVNDISAWYTNGDAVVFGNTDHNLVRQLNTFHFAGGQGRPVVFSNSNNIMSNGNKANGTARGNTVFKSESMVNLLGYETGSSLVANPANNCNGAGASGCGPTTITKATSSLSFWNDPFLAFADVSNLAAGTVVNCGVGHSGYVMPNSYVGGLRASPAVISFYYPRPMAGDVTLQGTTGVTPATMNCMFSYGISKLAVPGSYTITNTSPTTFAVTAPTGGHSQVANLVNGFIRAADFVVPFAGPPSPGDFWTLTVPSPSGNNKFYTFDIGNNLYGPNAEPGATFATGNELVSAPVQYGIPGIGQPVDFSLRGQSLGGAAATLTANGQIIAYNNCGAIMGNTQLTFSATLNAFDLENPTNFVTATWGGGPATQHVLSRQDYTTSARLDGVTTAINADSVTGMDGSIQTLTAELPVACLTASFQPPNTDDWTIIMRVTGTITP